MQRHMQCHELHSECSKKKTQTKTSTLCSMLARGTQAQLRPSVKICSHRLNLTFKCHASVHNTPRSCQTLTGDSSRGNIRRKYISVVTLIMSTKKTMCAEDSNTAQPNIVSSYQRLNSKHCMLLTSSKVSSCKGSDTGMQIYS